MKKNSMIKYVVDRIEQITQDLRLGRATKPEDVRGSTALKEAISLWMKKNERHWPIIQELKSKPNLTHWNQMSLFRYRL